uniref:ELM2 domain-containing protein n=1 Tax=Ascaris lumbricoides TaxID=6252 RepID=A0A0M3ICZ5_ASCLU
MGCSRRRFEDLHYFTAQPLPYHALVGLPEAGVICAQTPSSNPKRVTGMSKWNPEVRLDNLTSEFEYRSMVKKKKSRGEFWKETPGKLAPVSRSEVKGVFDEEHSRIESRQHKELRFPANDYFLCHLLTSFQNVEIMHISADLKEAADRSWEFRLSKKYYEKIFKEYCIADLTHYKKIR